MPREIIEQVANCKRYDDGTLLIQNVRFSYPHVDAPWAKKEGETKKYSIVGLLPKSTHKAAAKLVKKVIDEIAAEKKQKSPIPKDRFLRDGDRDSNKDEYSDHYTINASETKPVSVRGPDTRPIPQGEIARKVQPGYWGDILIRPWWQDNEHGKKVNAGLVAVQVKKEDEIFGEGRISEEDIDETFDSVADDESGFDDEDDEL